MYVGCSQSHQSLGQDTYTLHTEILATDISKKKKNYLDLGFCPCLITCRWRLLDIRYVSEWCVVGGVQLYQRVVTSSTPGAILYIIYHNNYLAVHSPPLRSHSFSLKHCVYEVKTVCSVVAGCPPPPWPCSLCSILFFIGYHDSLSVAHTMPETFLLH